MNSSSLMINVWHFYIFLYFNLTQRIPQLIWYHSLPLFNVSFFVSSHLIRLVSLPRWRAVQWWDWRCMFHFRTISTKLDEKIKYIQKPVNDFRMQKLYHIGLHDSYFIWIIFITKLWKEEKHITHTHLIHSIPTVHWLQWYT